MAQPINVYGHGDIAPHLKPFPQLTQAQCDALAELSADLRPDQTLDVMQTYTESGGTRLYVIHPAGHEYHVARNGNIFDLGAH